MVHRLWNIVTLAFLNVRKKGWTDQELCPKSHLSKAAFDGFVFLNFKDQMYICPPKSRGSTFDSSIHLAKAGFPTEKWTEHWRMWFASVLPAIIFVLINESFATDTALFTDHRAYRGLRHSWVMLTVWTQSHVEQHMEIQWTQSEHKWKGCNAVCRWGPDVRMKGGSRKWGCWEDEEWEEKSYFGKVLSCLFARHWSWSKALGELATEPPFCNSCRC